MLCCPLDQATAVDVDDASTNFTDSIKDEAAHGVATPHVSQGSVAPGTGVAELGTAPLPDRVLAPSGMSLSHSVFVPLEWPLGP